MGSSLDTGYTPERITSFDASFTKMMERVNKSTSAILWGGEYIKDNTIKIDTKKTWTSEERNEIKAYSAKRLADLSSGEEDKRNAIFDAERSSGSDLIVHTIH